MFALLISMLRFKSIIFYQTNPKIKLFLQKNAKFSSAGGSTPRPPRNMRLPPEPQTPAVSHVVYETLYLASRRRYKWKFIYRLLRTAVAG